MVSPALPSCAGARVSAESLYYSGSKEFLEAGKRIVARRFVALPKCRIVERTFVWISRNRCLAGDCERYVRTVIAVVCLAMIRITLRRLTRPSPALESQLLGSALRFSSLLQNGPATKLNIDLSGVLCRFSVRMSAHSRARLWRFGYLVGISNRRYSAIPVQHRVVRSSWLQEK